MGDGAKEVQPAGSGGKGPVESTPLVDPPPPEEEDGFGKFMKVCKHHAGLIFAVVFLMACQSGMLLVNKAVMIVWDLPITVTIFQMVFCDLVLVTLFFHTLRVGKWADARRWALMVPWLFALMLASSMLALHYSSTGAVVVTRNIAPIVTLAIEATLKEKVTVDVWTVGALVFTLIGVLLYMLNDVEFSGIGFICIIANMAAGVLERITQRRLIAVEPVDLSKMTLVLINNSVAILPVALLLLPTKEYNQWHSLGWNDKDGPDSMVAYVWLVLSCVVGICIGWAGINAQFYLTATSFMVVGNVNKFIVIAVGMIVMGESSSWEAIVGCIIAISGGFFYGIARNNLSGKEKKAREAKAAAEKAEAEKGP